MEKHKKYYSLILLSTFLLQSCSGLGLGKSYRNTWIAIDNGITDYFKYEVMNYSKEDIASLKDNLGRVYDGKRCMDEDGKNVDLLNCESVQLIINDPQTFFAEWRSLSIDPYKLRFHDMVLSDLVDDYNERILKINEMKVKAAVFVKKYNLELFASNKFPSLSGLGARIDSQIINRGYDAEVAKLQDLILRSKKIQESDDKQSQKCASFEREVDKLYTQITQLPEQILKDNPDLKSVDVDNEIKKKSKKYADRLKVIQTNDRNKGCPSYLDTKFGN